MNLTIGEKIMILRKRAKLSHKELAQKLGISTSNIYSYESGKYKPRNSIIIRLADVFKVSIDFFIGSVDV